MKVIAIISLLLAACAPATDLIQHGNTRIQFTQTQNQWGENITAVTQCAQLENGFCPKDAPTQFVVTSGKLPGLVSAGMQAGAVLGGSVIIADGLRGSKSTINQKNHNRTDVRASTVNPR